MFSLSVDRRLAEGVDPHGDRALERRSHKLARSRQSLAAAPDGTLREVASRAAYTAEAD